jgi:hypothetical protein
MDNSIITYHLVPYFEEFSLGVTVNCEFIVLRELHRTSLKPILTLAGLKFEFVIRV